MEEENESKKTLNVKETVKSSEEEVVKSAKTKGESENKMSRGVQTGIGLVIGLLAIVVLVLLGYIMYQTGKNSTGNKDGEIVTMDKIVDNKKDGGIAQEQDSQSDIVLERDDKTKVSEEVVSESSISAEDLNKLDDELDGISTHYDDLEDVGTDLQK